MTKKRTEVIVKVLVRTYTEEAAAENFGIPEKEALEDYGAFEETALSEKDKDLLFDAFAKKAFTSSDQQKEERDL